MGKFKVETSTATEQDQGAAAENTAAECSHNDGDFATKATTIGVVAVGAALIEAALLPGIVIGVAAAYAPKYLPKLGERVQPLFHSTVRGIYKLGHKARSCMGEVHEHMNDIAAEVHAEEAAKAETAPPNA